LRTNSSFAMADSASLWIHIMNVIYVSPGKQMSRIDA
jgi:hypothetical protein